MKSSPARTGPLVVVGTDGGRLVAVDAESGKVRWSFEAPDRIDSSPVVLDGVVVVGSDGGTVYAVGADDGDARGVVRDGRPGAVVTHGHRLGCGGREP